MQAALISFLSCQGAQALSVKRLLLDAWESSATLADQVWSHIGGPAMFAAAQNQSEGVQPFPIPSPKLQQPQLTKLIDLLTAIVQEIEHVEGVVAVAESLARRLHGCPNAQAELMNCSLGLPTPSMRDAMRECAWVLFHCAQIIWCMAYELQHRLHTIIEIIECRALVGVAVLHLFSTCTSAILFHK